MHNSTTYMYTGKDQERLLVITVSLLVHYQFDYCTFQDVNLGNAYSKVGIRLNFSLHLHIL
jgi:hypothetical protein